jgi:hypothetical protein
MRRNKRSAFHERVVERLASEPGVVSAAIATVLPLTGETWIGAVAVPGDKRPDIEQPMMNVRFASADYFRTVGIPLLAGRNFSASDRLRDVVAISERVAHVLWPVGMPWGAHWSLTAPTAK